MARSRWRRTPVAPCELNHELPDVECVTQKQMRCSPLSPAVNVNRPLGPPLLFTTRWSLSKISCVGEEEMRVSCCMGDGDVELCAGTYIDSDLDCKLVVLGVHVLLVLFLGAVLACHCQRPCTSWRRVCCIPTTSVSLGRSSKKHFGVVPSM